MPDPTDPLSTPPSPAAPSDPALAPTGEASVLQPNIAAALASFFPLLGGIVFLVIEKKNAFVRFYAMQSVFLGGCMFAFFFIAGAAGMILGHVPLLGWVFGGLLALAVWLVWFTGLVLAVICAIKAFGGTQEWEIPVLGKLARQQLSRGGI